MSSTSTKKKAETGVLALGPVHSEAHFGTPSPFIVRNPTDELAVAFPAVDPGVEPYGSRVLVQIRRAKDRSDRGVLYADDTKDTEKWNTQIGKVVALGPLCFRSRQVKDGQEFPKLWPEGEWCKVGDFVRVPKYGGDRWEVEVPDGRGDALFVIFNDLDLIGKVTGDPLKVKAYV